jgi:3-phenylpropionate/trans-cinnamate dioxygenase ferredoxin component
MADVEEHAERILEMVREFAQLEDEQVRAKVFELLEHIDHLHRSCVWRVFELMTELGGKGLVDRMAQDAAVKTLFMLYDLIPVDPLMPVEATVRVTQPSASGFIPLRSVGGRRPAWKVSFARQDLPPGSLRGVEIDGLPVLLCALKDGDAVVFAYRNACGRSVLPLHLGTLVGDEINCPWHGCRYDARTGRALSGSTTDLEPLAVSVRDGVVYVATNVSANEAADSRRSQDAP